MRIIQQYVEAIDEELEGAKEYAEKFVEARVKGDTATANRYREMVNDELKHASYEHEWAIREIGELSKLYTPPVSMQEKWDKEHKKYVEAVSQIRQMLEI